MPEREVKDPLSAAITAYFKPAVTPYGFKKRTGRAFDRVRDNLVQHMGFQLSAYGRKDFCVNYSTVPLFLPHDFFGWLFGGRFPRGKSNDGWWKSKTPAFANEAVQEVARTFESRIIQWFEATATVEGLLTEIARSRPTPNPHVEFNFGCCLLWMGRDSDARTAIEIAKVAYEASYREMPAREWAAKSAGHCDELIRAVEQGTGRSVLEAWRDASITKLKLERICSS